MLPCSQFSFNAGKYISLINKFHVTKNSFVIKSYDISWEIFIFELIWIKWNYYKMKCLFSQYFQILRKIEVSLSYIKNKYAATFKQTQWDYSFNQLFLFSELFRIYKRTQKLQIWIQNVILNFHPSFFLK